MSDNDRYKDIPKNYQGFILDSSSSPEAHGVEREIIKNGRLCDYIGKIELNL